MQFEPSKARTKTALEASGLNLCWLKKIACGENRKTNLSVSSVPDSKDSHGTLHLNHTFKNSCDAGGLLRPTKLYYFMFTGCWRLSIYYQYALWHLCKNSKSIKNKAKQNISFSAPTLVGATILVCWNSMTSSSWSYTLELYIQNEFTVHSKLTLSTQVDKKLNRSCTVRSYRALTHTLRTAHKISNRSGSAYRRGTRLTVYSPG